VLRDRFVEHLSQT